jgi:hypothetical protein
MTTTSEGAPALSPEATASPAAGPGIGKRLGFRFLFAYFVLYSFPFPLGALPWTEKVGELYSKIFDPIILWVGANLLGIDYPIATEFNGSGDRTYDYVRVLCLLAMAAVATAIWTLIDRTGRRDERLVEWLRLYVRVVLATTMLGYGFAKIFQGQFAPPGPWQLAKTYGESSPATLLWTFMGYSRPYTIFAGLMEAIPGALLFFRRTSAVGALLLLAVLGNVVLLNLCYDVPVKLYSSHLWLMSLFLAAPALSRLVSALILNRAVSPAPAVWLFRSRRASIAATVLFTVLVGALAFERIYPTWKVHVQRTSQPAVDLKFEGAFHVAQMMVDGVELPARRGDARRWNRFWIGRQSIQLSWSDGRNVIYRSDKPIEGPSTLELRLWTDPEGTRRGRLELRREENALVVQGELEGVKVRATLSGTDGGSSLLMTRGFHWINEVPYYR